MNILLCDTLGLSELSGERVQVCRLKIEPFVLFAVAIMFVQCEVSRGAFPLVL